MSGHELRTWLLTDASGETAFEARPDTNLSPLGEKVVQLLNKRRVDVVDDDLAVMAKVVDVVGRELSDPRPDDPVWRRRLMTVGHDPLKPDSPRPDEETDLGGAPGGGTG